MKKVEIYEDNGGGIYAVCYDCDGNVANVVIGLEGLLIGPFSVAEFAADAKAGFPGAYDYDPDDYNDVPMEEMAEEITSGNDLIAVLGPETHELYPRAMGYAGMTLFGIECDD